MLSALISLIVTLAVIYIVYLIVDWALGFVPIVPAIFRKVLSIVFMVVAVVAVLNFVAVLLGVGGFESLRLAK